MSAFITFLGTYGPLPLVLALLIGVPAIVNFISWGKATWAKREKFKEDNVERGRAIEREEEAEELRFSNGEARIKALEENVKTLTTIVT